MPRNAGERSSTLPVQVVVTSFPIIEENCIDDWLLRTASSIEFGFVSLLLLIFYFPYSNV